MEFRRDIAVQTLRNVLQLLAALLAGLDAGLLADLDRVVRQRGPEIARQRPESIVEKAIALLNDLWPMRSRLPSTVVQALQAGLQPQLPTGSRRVDPVVIRVEAADRQALLVDLAVIADFRTYRRPASLARRVSALIASHQDRLTADELVQWQALDQAWQNTNDPVAYLSAVERLLGKGIATLRRLFERNKDWVDQTLRMADLEAAPRLATSTDISPAGDLVERFVNAIFPAQLLLSQRSVPLIVQIARQHAGGGVFATPAEARVELRLGDLTLVLLAEDFQIVNVIGGLPVAGASAARIVTVEAERDCPPVVYLLDPVAAGHKTLSIDIYQYGRNIATLSFAVDVLDQDTLVNPTAVAAEPVSVASLSPLAEPPDLELRVALSNDRRRLTFMLHSARTGDYNFSDAGEVDLTVDPQAFLQPLYDRLSTLAQQSTATRTPAETDRAVAELAQIGINLFERVFSQKLKEEYARFRETYRGKTLLITTDEPWIPWEMVRPYLADDQGNVRFDDPPLCEMFRVSRWLAGRGAPDQVSFRRGVWVVPSDNLIAAQAETTYFEDLNRQEWDVSLVGPLSTLADVQGRFRSGETELYHFACHGNFVATEPGESKLKLSGDFLRPSEIVGPLQSGLRRARPLVFLNACYSGAGGFALTKLDGWAQRFVGAAGASAFVGSQWEINDELAARFATEFYNRLWGVGDNAPLTLGEAFHAARQAVKQSDPANPTWLAYTLYGDPNGRVALGAAAS